MHHTLKEEQHSVIVIKYFYLRYFLVVNTFLRTRKNGEEAMSIIKRLCAPDCIGGFLFACSEKFYALAALEALFSQVELDGNMSAPASSLSFSLISREGTMTIGTKTTLVIGTKLRRLSLL